MTHKFIRVNNIVDKKYIKLKGSNKAFPKSQRPSKKTQEPGMGLGFESLAKGVEEPPKII